MLDEMIKGLHEMKMRQQEEEKKTRERRAERRRIPFGIEPASGQMDMPTVLAHVRVGRPPEGTRRTRDDFHVWAMLAEAADAWGNSDRFRGPFMKTWRQIAAEIPALLKVKLGGWDAVRRETVGVMERQVQQFLRTPKRSVETSTDPVEHQEVAVQTEDPKSLLRVRNPGTPKIQKPDIHK
jgi:hypothetical protein